MSAETERIAQGTPHFALLRLVQREVQVRVDLRVEVVAVDGRGNHAVRDGEDAGQGLGSSGSTCLLYTSPSPRDP